MHDRRGRRPRLAPAVALTTLGPALLLLLPPFFGAGAGAASSETAASRPPLPRSESPSKRSPKKWAGEQRADDARAALRTGRWEEAEATTRLLLAGRNPRGEWAVLHAEALGKLGREDEARRELVEAHRAEPTNLAVVGPLLRLMRRDDTGAGEDGEALAVQEELRQIWRTGRWSSSRVEDVLALVELARQENRWTDANRLLRDAIKAFPHDVRPNRVWGEILLEKHAAADAETSFQEALRLDPTDAEAHVGLARAAIELRYDIATAHAHLGSALAQNPRLPAALALQGELALDAEDLPAVEELVARLRSSNPRSWEATALAAGGALLLGNEEAYQAERARMRDRPDAGHFYAFVAEALGRQRRYEISARVAEDCRGQTPRYAPCLAALGASALRLGDEDRGLEALRAAFAVDAFDERVFNQLELFEKTIPAQYETIERGPFRFRIPKGRRGALDAAIAPFLQEVYRGYVSRYAYEPKLPVTIELYGEHASYAIRVVGTPDLSVSAVCFGRVIATEMPPTAGTNWGLVLAHELAHVFALGLSANRVPRWFTEGLSEFETARLRPEWTRHHGRLIWSALQRHAVPPMEQLSHAFLQATSPDDALLAYALSARAVAFLEGKAGFRAIRDALVSFARGAHEKDVLTSLGAQPLPALSQSFLARLSEDEARFDGQYLPLEARFAAPLVPSQSKDASVSVLDPGQVTAVLGEGLRAVMRGDVVRARAMEARLGSAEGADNARALAFLTASRLLFEGEPAAAYRTLAPGLAADHDAQSWEGYDVRRLLAEAALREGRAEVAELQIRRAIALDPLRVEPRRFLAKLVLEARARPPHVRIEALQELFRMDAVDAPLAKRLLEELAGVHDDKGVVKAEPYARFTDPSDPAILLRLGRAWLVLGNRQQATAAFERALLLGPPAGLAREITAAWEAARAAPAQTH